MTRRALVTGATGFIGAAVVRALKARGARIRVLHRPASDLRNLDDLGDGVERVVGDLRNPESLVRATSGCDWVFHVAARYRFGLRHAREIYRDNVDGTRNVLDAARAAGVERVVYTSTVGVLSLGDNGTPVDESRLATFRELAGPYKRSKWLAEKEAMRAASEGLPVVIVCPTAPVGPNDVKPTPTGGLIVDFLSGRMPAYVDTGLNLVAVEDVALGHILAAERGRVGERYILGHENLRLREILAILARLTGIEAPRFRVPKRLLLPAAWISEGFSSILRRDPRLSIENARMSQHYMFFDSTKARRELTWEPGSVEAALERAVAWFRDNGYVRGERTLVGTETGADTSVGAGAEKR